MLSYVGIFSWSLSTSEVHLAEFKTYLPQFCQASVNMFDPELVVYNAGTDILDGDPLGRLKVTCHGPS